MGKKKKEVPDYLYANDPFSNFAMVTSNLFTSWQFQELTHAAKNFYLICCVHKQTAEQAQCLYKALEEYYLSIGEEKSGFDLSLEAGTQPRAKKKSTKFVIPQSHLLQYGFKPTYATKLKNELIEKGFIKVFANEKKHAGRGVQGANRDFSKRVTIYEFTNDWKKREE